MEATILNKVGTLYSEGVFENQRLVRAITEPMTIEEVGPRVFKVVNGDSDKKEYTVTLDLEDSKKAVCTCPDWQYRHTEVGPCKHILRVLLTQDPQEVQAGTPHTQATSRPFEITVSKTIQEKRYEPFTATLTLSYDESMITRQEAYRDALGQLDEMMDLRVNGGIRRKEETPSPTPSNNTAPAREISPEDRIQPDDEEIDLGFEVIRPSKEPREPKKILRNNGNDKRDLKLAEAARQAKEILARVKVDQDLIAQAERAFVEAEAGGNGKTRASEPCREPNQKKDTSKHSDQGKDLMEREQARGRRVYEAEKRAKRSHH